ncbi:TIM-barrel domain-containing protein [Paenibacillus ginsengarvi]|uniref:Helix-turn-helix domain-containing protein n=1 Tax=Paenibacillus ginsengarvi TaxID=400777 RepID=A0A3B0C3Q4_9BACL|nr:TIM-barrel domain-containing protein [Paenibacillus ginsengarvi]RKN79004.1 helix-turn-helix domain-containing protein [Paenibacillus ginsengarvi]
MCAKSNGIVFEITSGGYLRVDSVSPGTLRIRLHETNDFPESALERYGIVLHRSSDDYSLEYDGPSCTIRTDKAALTVDTRNGCLSLCNERGETLTRQPERPWPVAAQGFGAHFMLADGERIYGLGDVKRDRIQHRGHRAEMRIENVHRYAPVPFMMSSRRWGVFINTTWCHEIDIGHTVRDLLTFQGTGGKLDYFLFVGDSYAELLDRYTDVVGKPVLLPVWAYGLTYVCHQQVNAREMVDDALNFRRAGIPCDMIGLEPGWMEKKYDHSVDMNWHPERFALPPYSKKSDTFIGALDKLDFKLSLWLTCMHDLSIEEERLALSESSSSATATLTEAPWYEHLRKFVDQGVSAFKLSGAPFGLETSGRRWGNGMSDDEMHNLYPILLAKQLHLGFKEQTGRRSMIYMANGYTGMQRYAATWAGTSDHQPALVSMLNHGMSGHIHTTEDMDVSTPEGIHFGFLQPWSQVNSWAYWRHPCLLEHELLQTFRMYAQLRYSLLPYIYSAAHNATRTGMPILRAMPLAFPDDPHADGLLHQYMFGDSLLVAVYTRTVYLPEGVWIDYWTGERHMGPKQLEYAAVAPVGGPLFVKAGAIIPVWPELSSIGPKQPEIIGLHLYLYGESEYVLIEDDGVTYGYLEQRIAETLISCRTTDKRTMVQIGTRKGNYGGMPCRRGYDVYLHVPAKPLQVTIDGSSAEETVHPPEAGAARDGWYFDRISRIVRLSAHEHPDKRENVTIEVCYDATFHRETQARHVRHGTPDSPGTNTHWETELEIGLETGDRVKAFAALEEWWAERIERIPNLDEARVNMLIICGLFVRVCIRQGWNVQTVLDGIYDAFVNIQVLFKKEQGYDLMRQAVQQFIEYRRSAKKSDIHPLIKQITDIVEKEIDDNITLHSMADRLHVNSSHLSRMFKQAVGQSFTDYVMIRKMERAKSLLIAGSSVSEAALQLGYKDTSHFIRVFRKYWGVTPGELKI